MRNILKAVFLVPVFLSCNGQPASDSNTTAKLGQEVDAGKEKLHFRGAISNGMKGDSISFDISPAGDRLENLSFKGYWRCDGSLSATTAGPESFYPVINGKVDGHISEPPDGGSTAWRFDLQATIKGTEASGSFRMNINNLGCDTYKLEWIAHADTE